jgi:hypothetical protein
MVPPPPSLSPFTSCSCRQVVGDIGGMEWRHHLLRTRTLFANVVAGSLLRFLLCPKLVKEQSQSDKKHSSLRLSFSPKKTIRTRNMVRQFGRRRPQQARCSLVKQNCVDSSWQYVGRSVNRHRGPAQSRGSFMLPQGDQPVTVPTPAPERGWL